MQVIGIQLMSSASSFMTQKYPSTQSKAYSWSVGESLMTDDSRIRVSASERFSHGPLHIRLSFPDSPAKALLCLSDSWLAFGSAHKSSTDNRMWQVKAILTFSMNNPLASDIYSENNCCVIQVAFYFLHSDLKIFDIFYVQILLSNASVKFGGVMMSFNFP